MTKWQSRRIYAPLVLGVLSVAVVAACAEQSTEDQPAAREEPRPEPVNGWVELPLADGVLNTQPNAWRTDVFEIPVAANGGELEYKFAMREGEGFVYAVTYENLIYADEFTVEFHGHTEKGPDGIGDLMFYSVTEGRSENGVFTAPFAGNHGWYLKNDSDEQVTVRLRLAGFYDVVGTIAVGAEPSE